MGNLLGDFGIRPKVIDYGKDTVNNNYREIEEENKLLDNKTIDNRKKYRKQ